MEIKKKKLKKKSAQFSRSFLRFFLDYELISNPACKISAQSGIFCIPATKYAELLRIRVPFDLKKTALCLELNTDFQKLLPEKVYGGLIYY